LIAPTVGEGSFSLITGEHGTGKTTLVCHCCKKVKKGVLYVYIPDNPALLPRKLGSVLQYDFQSLSFWSQLRRRYFGDDEREKPSELDVVLGALSKAGEQFRKQHRRPAVLVLDNLTILAKKDTEAFERLVRFAKYEADQKSLVIVFVSSEGHTPRKLLALSESSRLGEIVEIGDLTSDEVKRFLGERGRKKEAQEIEDIAGGRLRLLIQSIDLIRRKNSLQDIEMIFQTKVEQEISDKGLVLPSKHPTMLNQRQRKAWTEAVEIYDSPNNSITFNNFVQYVGSELSDELLRGNLFSFHQRENCVTFQSIPVRKYVGSIIGEHDSDQRRQVIELLSSPKSA